jgi:chitin synthase
MASSSPPPPVPSHGISETILHKSNEPEPNESTQPPRTLQRSDSTTSRVQRKKSLVRPERERIDPSHRQYHYRQRAAEHASRDGPFAASTTGNAPIYTAGSEEGISSAIQIQQQQQYATPPPPPPPRRRSLRDRVVPVRRGKSILGREDPDSHKERKHRSQVTDAQVNNTTAPPRVERTPSVNKAMHRMDKDTDYKEPKQWPSCWYMYSMVVSIWIPNFVLSTFGKLPYSCMTSVVPYYPFFYFPFYLVFPKIRLGNKRFKLRVISLHTVNSSRIFFMLF